MNRMTPSSSQAALRNLLLVLLVTVGFMIYAYGWTVTDIDLSKPQEPSRQQNVTSALQELLSPRIFEQDRELIPARANVLVGCESGTSPDATASSETEPYVVVSPTCGQEGDVVTVTAFNYAPNAEARIRWIPIEGQSRPREVLETGRQEITLDASGGFSGQIEIPRISGSDGQMHEVEFVAATPSGVVRFSNTTNEVLRRMAETIFMALMATSLAIPISAVLSFFAARNLMRPVRTPLGNMMVAVIALPIGFWLGSVILGAIGQFGLDFGRGQFFGMAAVSVPFIFVLGTTTASRSLSVTPDDDITAKLRAVGTQLLVVVVVVLVIGLIGGLGLLGSTQFNNLANSFRPSQVATPGQWLINALADGIAGFGRMIQILGQIVELLIIPIGGIAGAFTLSTSVTRFTTVPMRNVSGLLNHSLGLILGAASGAIIVMAVGYIGMSAALFGLLVPLVAGIMAGQIMSLLYNRLLVTTRGHTRPNPIDRWGRLIVTWIGIVIAFVVTFDWLNINRALIDGTLPSAVTFSYFGLELPEYIFKCLVVGGVLGAIGGGLAGVQSTFMIGDVLYNVTRNILNALRSIEPLIMGLIFVIWVGIGPFAGVLALTLHSIASLGKLYSEQIETIDEGPIEALKSTGANHLQTIIYAVVPQVIPPYIAFTMYRWDINVRMSTIIGFVGGGGIGLLLNQQINLLRYRDAGVAVLAIAIVVSILDYASASIRERII